MTDPIIFPLPAEIGDTYLLIDYPASGQARLARAYQDVGDEPGRWKWWLGADDGDQFPCGSVAEAYAATGASEIRLVRRATDGLADAVWKVAPEFAAGLALAPGGVQVHPVTAKNAGNVWDVGRVTVPGAPTNCHVSVYDMRHALMQRANLDGVFLRGIEVDGGGYLPDNLTVEQLDTLIEVLRAAQRFMREVLAGPPRCHSAVGDLAK